MNKNVIVLDESGNEIGATYLKRARGLVKKGRAQFVSESSIRLTPMPDHKEGDKMSEENRIETMETVAAAEMIGEDQTSMEQFISRVDQAATAGDCRAVEEQTPTENSGEESAEPVSRDTAEYCLKQMEAIRTQTAYLDQAIAEVRSLAATGNDRNAAVSDLANALADMIRARETTNQQMLAFYEKMYEDRKRVSPREIFDAKRSMTEKSLETIEYLGVSDFDVNKTTDLFNAVQETIRMMG